jgi:hypothetical protein
MLSEDDRPLTTTLPKLDQASRRPRTIMSAQREDPTRETAPEDIMNIAQAPHGINVVVETERIVYIGRFDQSNGFQVKLHDAAKHELLDGEDAEMYIRQTAKYGVPVQHKDLVFDAQGIRRVRKLGDVPKE